MTAMPEQRKSYADQANGPYSLGAMLSTLNNNAALIFLGLSILIAGFLAGSMWQENRILRKGGLTALAPAAAPAAPGAAAPAAAPAGPLSDEDWAAIQENPAGVIGDKNAKIVMVEFTDYQCPFCSRYFNDSYGALKQKYVDSGKMKIIFRDQALSFHPNAKPAAHAARCANEQGKFEAMHDSLFKNQDAWANLANAAAVTKFGELATAAGLNGNSLVTCVNSGKFNAAIEADAALGSRVGANGTPTFFVNKEILVGAQPTSVFEATIDKSI